MKIAALFLLISLAPLQGQDRTGAANVDEAFRLAGIRTMLTPLMNDAGIKDLDPDAFYRQLRAYFLKHYDASHMDHFLALERTPVYRTMHRLEEAAGAPGAESARRRFEANLQSDPPPPKRLDLLRRLADATNGGNDALNRNLFVYRNTDDTELEDYIAAAQQPDVAWFNRNLQSAVQAIAADRAAASAAEALKPKVYPKPGAN